MAERASIAPKLVAITILPPPITGQTLVSQAICEIFAKRLAFELRAIRNEGGHTGVTWTLRKHGRLLGALLAAMLTRRRGQRGYFVADAGGGLWFNVIEALFMRFAFEKVWFHHHVFSYVRQADPRMRLIHAILGRKLHHIALGAAMETGLKAHYQAQNVTVLGNTPFVTDTPEARVRPTLKTIGFLGNISKQKGIHLFMETAERALAQAPQMRCRIAGPIRDASLRAEVEAFCAADPDRRAWVGPVRDADKVQFLNEIDVLLFPSLYPNEALPMTIYEALAAGAPVLATPRGCIPDQLAGQSWVFPDAEFSGAAADQLAVWGDNSAAFAQASSAALQQFATQAAESQLALEMLLKDMAA